MDSRVSCRTTVPLSAPLCRFTPYRAGLGESLDTVRKVKVFETREEMTAFFVKTWYRAGLGESLDTVRKVKVFETREEMTAFFVKTWSEVSRKAVAERGEITAALSGGKTPVDAYRALAAERELLPWKHTRIFLADERFVPLTDNESNFHMIEETLLAPVSIPRENVNPVRTDKPGPDDAAKQYEERLASHFALVPGEFPRFDILLLGLGEDGHTASLFPGSPVLEEKVRLARGVFPGGTLRDRVTLTLPVINNGRHIIFLVTGKGKAHALRRVMDGDESLPASRVLPNNGSLLFLADGEAAELLSEKDPSDG
jgi:6-phosphogluconolactonase